MVDKIINKDYEYKRDFIKKCINKKVKCNDCGYNDLFEKEHGFVGRRYFEIDHIVPYRILKQHKDNLQILCIKCHAKKTGLEKRELYKLRGWKTFKEKKIMEDRNGKE